jgi:4-amino-4-deoxy-L-arabinose transferase-like glycosyltransferase
MLSKKLLLNFLPLVLIIVLASVLRLLWLDKVPNAIGGDELTYVINAKSLFLTGTDISGTWNPLTGFIFQYPAYTLPQAELPYYLLAPIVGATDFSLFTARITYSIISILSVLLIFLIAKELIDRRVGLIAGFIAAINPWFIYLGRTSYEGNPAIFFFLLALLVLIKAKGNRILISIPIFFLAFYSYIGTKLAFIPFVLVSCLYCYFVINKKKYLKEYVIVFGSCFVLVALFAASFVFKVSSSPSRLGEVFTPNDPVIAKQVDAIRKVSMQSPLTNIFENKLTIYGRIVLTKLFKSLASDYLFVYGDNFYSILRHGMFYVLDALFVLLGLVGVYASKRKVFWFLGTLILVGLIPQIFHTADLGNMVFHVNLIFPFLIIFIAAGVWEILNIFRKKYYFYGSLAITIVLYLSINLNFMNIYFFQWPLQGYFDFHVRLFSKYVSLAGQNNKKVLIYSSSNSDIFKKYLFYSNSYNKNTLLTIRSIYKMNKFNFGNLYFMGCDNTIDPSKMKDLVIYDFQCGNLKKDYPHISIPRLSDGGQSYEIFNDSVCKTVTLKRYPTNLSVDDFSIENMGRQKFCETFITNL